MKVDDRPRSAESARGTPQVLTVAEAATLGWLPVLALIGALGVIQVALADDAARQGMPWAEAAFWTGLATIFIPYSARLLMRDTPPHERIGLLLVLTLELYVAMLLLSPLGFTGFDELAHWRTAQDIGRTGHLFTPNPLLPISAKYPGLEIVTNALASLVGASTFAAGIVVIGVARLIGVLALYLFYEQVTRSPWVAGIAGLLYMANPNFLTFDAAFSYESFALPLAALVIYVALTRVRRWPDRAHGLMMVLALAFGAVVITHHLTSYNLVAFLLLWAIILVIQRRRLWVKGGPGGPALLGLALCVIWLAYVGNDVAGYVVPHITSGVQQLAQILTGHAPVRPLFHDSAGDVTPLWERITAFAAVALILLGLPFGIVRIWQRHRAQAIVLALAIVALLYPITQALRLTQAGAETADRATEFVFVGLALVLAAALTESWLTSAPAWRRYVPAVAVVAILFIGGAIAGSGPVWNRLPGPYLVSADSRSISPEGITAAQWAGTHLGPGQRVITDRIDQMLMGTYGGQHPVTGFNDGLPIPTVFFSPQLDSYDRSVLRAGRVRYVEIDQRLSTGLPHVGVYFEIGEPGSFQHATPISRAALMKFNGVPGVNRIYDSGNIVIYDIGGITNVP